MLLALKMEGGIMDQGMSASKPGKGKEIHSSLKPPEMNAALSIPRF